MRYFACLLLAWSFASYSQENHQKLIADNLRKYFEDTRENLHLHLHKSSFISGEDIYFKGYVIDKQAGLPFGPTVNVYVQLLDASGQMLANKLYYAEDSMFEGKLTLPETLPSGVYYLQAYTNFMNNFNEDESSVYRISVVNADNGQLPDVSLAMPHTAKLEFYPEGGTFLAGTQNTFGVALLDCHGNGLEITHGQINDSAGKPVATFSTNRQGYGRFVLNENGSGPYHATHEIEGQTVTTPLPIPQQQGVVLSVANYLQAAKATLKIRTNSLSLPRLEGKPLSVVIQRNAAAAFVSVMFDPNQPEQTLSIPKEYFSDGINTVWLIDAGNEVLARRTVYSAGSSAIPLGVEVAGRNKDSITIKGSAIPLADLSISVLPAGTISARPDKSMATALEFDAYLKSPFANGGYYLSNPTRAKYFELDNALLCNQSKYEWQSMMTGKVDKKYPFDQGFDVIGTLNSAPSKKYKVRINSLSQGIDQTTTPDEKNQFLFKNLVIADSAIVYFSLMDKEKILPTKVSARIENNNRRFMKKFYPTAKKCAPDQYAIFGEELKLPTLKDAIQIDAVEVTENKRDKLTDRSKKSALHTKVLTRGYKISEDDVRTFRDVLSFLQFRGFNVINDGLNIRIQSRVQLSFRGTNSPAIFLDDAPLNDNYRLFNMSLEEVDEIYINDRGYGGGSIDGAVYGIIRIYTKKTFSNGSGPKVNSGSMLVRDGFQPYPTFKNPYAEYQSSGFQQLGVIDWEPRVKTDATGAFQFSVPNLSQNSVILWIEGIGSDGQQFSETFNLKIK